MTPELRVQAINDIEPDAGGRYILYWMTSARRARSSFALQRTLEWAGRLHKPVLVLEALRAGYPWASDRLHRFVIDGMEDNRAAFGKAGVAYYPYVEPEVDAGKGLLAALAGEAAVVVTDEFPGFFLPRMRRAAATGIPVRYEAVDTNGLLPLRAPDRAFLTAYAFRRFLQKELPGHLAEMPDPDPLRKFRSPGITLPRTITERWPVADLEGLKDLSRLPIPHNVEPASQRGGETAARRALDRFMKQGFPRYVQARNDPDAAVTSGLSPYLHFGHISAHQVFDRLAREEGWSRQQLSSRTDGKRSGWWGMSEGAEAFLDQLVTWRELGYGFCHYKPDCDTYDSLPPWALDTLEEHASDPREHVYTLGEFEDARTHDPLWNAAQRQLVTEGTIHNTLRMLWGKKILEWTPHPRDALDIMLELNNKYALDGRDPNSVSGIFWILGRFDRPWGPERPVFGKIRTMTSRNTARKVSVGAYLERYGETAVTPAR